MLVFTNRTVLEKQSDESAFTRAPLQHEYFIAEQRQTLDDDLLEVFARFFASDDDIPVGCDPCDVYGGAATAFRGSAT